MYKTIRYLNQLTTALVLFLLRLYQTTFSRWLVMASGNHHQGCRFYPSCSAYTIQTIENFGLVIGLWHGLGRVLRCHPWSEGGVDYPASSRHN